MPRPDFSSPPKPRKNPETTFRFQGCFHSQCGLLPLNPPGNNGNNKYNNWANYHHHVFQPVIPYGKSTKRTTSGSTSTINLLLGDVNAGSRGSAKQDLDDRLENLSLAAQRCMRISGEKNGETSRRNNQPACRAVIVKSHVPSRLKVAGQPLAAGLSGSPEGDAEGSGIESFSENPRPLGPESTGGVGL